MDVLIRFAELKDASELSEIYRPYVERTAITYEYDAPDATEFSRRIENTLKNYPYYVAECRGKVVGYAYAGAFKARKAYDRSVETSIYVAEAYRGQGIGKKLYDALEKELQERGITNMYACIAYPEKEDEYLSYSSRYFHEHIGFELVGEFHKCANKFGRWYGMIWMEKFIGEHI